MITVNNVTKCFGNYKALDAVEMEIERGCIYGLVGTNGSGKSTLLRLISGVYSANGGDIELDGNTLYRAMVNRNRQNTRLTGVNAMA